MMLLASLMKTSHSKLGIENAKGILKAELKRRNMTYADLVENLSAVGVTESEANIRNKISRGTFTAAFFLQCLLAIGCNHVVLNKVD
ncbi:MAG: DUF6471 domain-containing protein [Aquidulcibacter sp.]